MRQISTTCSSSACCAPMYATQWFHPAPTRACPFEPARTFCVVKHHTRVGLILDFPSELVCFTMLHMEIGIRGLVLEKNGLKNRFLPDQRTCFDHNKWTATPWTIQNSFFLITTPTTIPILIIVAAVQPETIKRNAVSVKWNPSITSMSKIRYVHVSTRRDLWGGIHLQGKTAQILAVTFLIVPIAHNVRMTTMPPQQANRETASHRFQVRRRAGKTTHNARITTRIKKTGFLEKHSEKTRQQTRFRENNKAQQTPTLGVMESSKTARGTARGALSTSQWFYRDECPIRLQIQHFLLWVPLSQPWSSYSVLTWNLVRPTRRAERTAVARILWKTAPTNKQVVLTQRRQLSHQERWKLVAQLLKT